MGSRVICIQTGGIETVVQAQAVLQTGEIRRGRNAGEGSRDVERERNGVDFSREDLGILQAACEALQALTAREDLQEGLSHRAL